MGWSNGPEIGEYVWNTVKKYIPEEDKQKVAKKIYDKFNEYDADDWSMDEDSLWAIAEPEEYKQIQEEED